jgi:hypothetical protein
MPENAAPLQRNRVAVGPRAPGCVRSVAFIRSLPHAAIPSRQSSRTRHFPTLQQACRLERSSRNGRKHEQVVDETAPHRRDSACKRWHTVPPNLHARRAGGCTHRRASTVAGAWKTELVSGPDFGAVRVPPAPRRRGELTPSVASRARRTVLRRRSGRRMCCPAPFRARPFGPARVLPPPYVGLGAVLAPCSAAGMVLRAAVEVCSVAACARACARQPARAVGEAVEMRHDARARRPIARR